MRRFPAQPLTLVLLIAALLALTACGGGGGSSSGTPSQIVVSPSTVVLPQGGRLQISASVEDSGGAVLSKFTPSFAVTSGGNLASVSINGLVCAGHWDSLTTPVVCTPPSLDQMGNPSYGLATVTVSVNNVNQNVTVDVLPPVDNLSITAGAVSDTKADSSGLNCVSQQSTTNTRTYTAVLSYKGKQVDISSIKDAFTWSIASTVGAIAASTDSNNNTDSSSAVVTAKIPGRTQVTATLSSSTSGTPTGTTILTSTPADFVTCPVSSIQIGDSNNPDTHQSALNTSATLTLTPTIKDSRGYTVNLADSSGTAIFSLGWDSSRIPVATVGATGIVTANAASGTSSIIATCTPPTCNAGLGAVYSNVHQVNVTGTNTSTSIYVGSAGSTNVYPVSSTDSSVGTAITIGDKPNSMLFDGPGAVLYIGTNTGLVTIAPSTNTATSPYTSAPGKILAISPDSSTLLISNADVVTDKSKSQVFVYFTTSATFQALNITNASAAAFAPDGSEAYIVGKSADGTTDQLTIYQSGVFPSPATLTGASSVSFLASGAFGVIAASGNSALGIRATCNNFDKGTPAVSGTPTLVAALPDGQNLVSVAAPSIDLVTVASDNAGFASSANGCSPSAPNASVAQSLQLNSGTAFTAKQLIVTSDGTKAYVLSDAGSLLGVSINGTTLADASITLSGNAVPTTGGATLDGKFIWVGGSDGNLHKVDLTAKTDTTKSVATDFSPDFVAVQPH